MSKTRSVSHNMRHEPATLEVFLRCFEPSRPGHVNSQAEHNKERPPEAVKPRRSFIAQQSKRFRINNLSPSKPIFWENRKCLVCFFSKMLPNAQKIVSHSRAAMPTGAFQREVQSLEGWIKLRSYHGSLNQDSCFFQWQRQLVHCN